MAAVLGQARTGLDYARPSRPTYRPPWPVRNTGCDCMLMEIQTEGMAKRGGHEVQTVMRLSAVVFVWKEETIPIISNRTDMVKFAKADGKGP
jgi:hypothetical protein